MASGNPALVELIRARIRERGPVTFAWFMEQALYHPEHGYYSSGRARIGRRGDYFTNVSVGPLFGRLMAAQFAEMWEALERPDDFVIVEQGGHHGDFARDVLEAARVQHEEFFHAVRYRMIEPFPVLRDRQQAALREFVGKIEWHDSLENLPAFRGVHFSNELIDAMPVHLLKRENAPGLDPTPPVILSREDGEGSRTQASDSRAGLEDIRESVPDASARSASLRMTSATAGPGWKERHVNDENGEFVFVDLPLSQTALLKDLPQLPNECYETEINLGARAWLEGLTTRITQGFVVIADYGFSREEFYAPHRSHGTLRCYAQQRVTGSPLSEVGHTDITAHVEWTSLSEAAGNCGLNLWGFADQHHFLAGLLVGGLATELEKSADPKTKRQLQTLLHPELMGTRFQFLVLGKNLPSSVQLSGLRFARGL